MGKKAKAPTPAPVTSQSMGQDISNYVAGYGQALPGLLSFEQQYRPQFAALNIAEMNQYQQAAQEAQARGTTAAQQQLQAARGAEFTGMGDQTAQVRGIIGGISPEAKRMMELQNLQAEQAYASSQGLSAQERRLAQQGARESYGVAGRLGGNLGIVGEAMGRENVLTQKRQEAAGRIGQAYETSQAFYSPAIGLLAGTPAAYGAGQQFAEYGRGMLGRSTPGLINPDVGLNLAAAGRRDLLQSQSANAAASASRSAGMMSAGGAIAGAAITAFAI